jgi:Family of unknown function (DUF6504)
MARVYGEPVEVQTSEDGRPTRFVWRSRVYTVRAVQEYWVVNRDWWRETAPVLERPELQFWRVEALTGKGRAGRTSGTGRTAPAARPGGTYELRKDVADGAWTLRQIAD